MENRGALVRVQGSPGDTSSHVEMRLSEPAANPYLYLASNIAAGLDGIRRNLEPPPPVSADPYATEAPPLPGSLSEAVTALDRVAAALPQTAALVHAASPDGPATAQEGAR